MLVMIRGKALTWYYLCDKCQLKLFKIDDSSRINCSLCQTRSKLPEEFAMCNACAFETQMCMACGAPCKIGDNYEEMQHKAILGKVAKRRRRKKAARVRR